MVRLDNRAADRKSNPHSISLGCIERLEEFGHSFWCKADTGINHTKAHPIAFVQLRFDEQLSLAFLNADHRIQTVAHQVEYDLL